MGPARGRWHEHGLVDMSIAPAPEQYTVDRSACRSESWYVDLLGECRLYFQQWYDDESRLADFLIVQEIRVGDGDEDNSDGLWAEVVRVDNCHSETHMHHFDQDGNEVHRKVLKPLRMRADIDSGLDLAEDGVYDHWEDNVRRWRDGR
jgi:hypothetical protein